MNRTGQGEYLFYANFTNKGGVETYSASAQKTIPKLRGFQPYHCPT